MSMLVLYLRLAPHMWFRWTCYVCIAIIACYSVTAALVESLACRPLEGIINESLDAVCYDSYPAYISLSSLRYSEHFLCFMIYSTKTNIIIVCHT